MTITKPERKIIMKENFYTLSNNYKIPNIGFGTFRTPRLHPDKVDFYRLLDINLNNRPFLRWRNLYLLKRIHVVWPKSFILDNLTL